MPIVLPKAPQFEESSLEPHLQRITKSNVMGPPGMLLRRRPENLFYVDPHRNYIVTLEEIAKGQLLTAAKPATWRYLITDGNSGVGELEMESTVDAQGNEMIERFVALHHSKAAQSTLEALHLIESSQIVNDDDYELRFLRISALYFDAIWLHAKNHDVIIPVFDRFKNLQEGKIYYSENEMISVLKPLAIKLQQFEAKI